ncbi:MAG: acetoacetate decarboxylase family protein [Candidatus Korarchaeum sp.]
MPWTGPITPSGRSALVPDGPWTYVMDVIAVHAKGYGERIASVLPQRLKPSGDLWFYVAEIISYSDSSEEMNYLAPDLLQYKEAAVFVKVELDGRSYAYCPFMYVDNDLSLVRGLIFGFPKKIAKIEMTRFHELFEPRRYGGLAYRAGYNLFRITVEPKTRVERIPLDDFGSWLLRRYFKPMGVDELIEFIPEANYARILSGEGSLELEGGFNDELDYFKPSDILGGYLYSVKLRAREIRSLGGA